MTKLFETAEGTITFYVMLGIAAFLVQLAPIVGLFAMMLMSVIWICVILHLMMIHLTIGAITGKFWTGWVVVPLCFYVGWYAVHWESSRRAKLEIAAIENINAEATIKAQPPLTFKLEQHDVTLISLFRVDRVTTPGRKAVLQAIDYAEGSGCDGFTRNTPKSDDGRYFVQSQYFPRYRPKGTERKCLIGQDVNADQSSRYYVKRSESNRTENFFNTIHTQEWTIEDTRTARKLKAKTASISVLPVVPIFLSGCIYLDRKGKCELVFLPGNDMKAGYQHAKHSALSGRKPDVSGQPIAVIAQVLSLEPRRQTD